MKLELTGEQAMALYWAAGHTMDFPDSVDSVFCGESVHTKRAAYRAYNKLGGKLGFDDREDHTQKLPEPPDESA